MFGKQKQFSAKNLPDLLDGYELPSFQGVVMDVLGALRDPDTSIQDIAQKLQADPGMHVKVLKTVNSAAFSLSSKVSNLHHAVIMLGRSRVEAIVLNHAVKDTLPQAKIENFSSRRYWLAATQRASLAQVIAQRIHPNTAVESFSVGLLQDMAIPVLATAKGEHYGRLLGDWINDESTCLHEMEMDTFGFDHPSIGAAMAQEWNLPDELVNGIASHHEDPDQVDVMPAVAIASRIRESEDLSQCSALVDFCKQALAISEEDARALLEQTFSDAAELCNLLG